MHPPPFFEEIRASAADQWNDLEMRPKSAGPWRELFRQIQRPECVLSELLQNADDAAAATASAEIQDGVLVFEHDGRDFTSTEFWSLCSFCFSNKRELRTIGFRGIGFKTAFSLGGSVELQTPTISVAFRKERFTEPIWIAREGDTGRLTRIRVTIEDSFRANALAESIKEWQRSPLSILFFANLTRLRLQGRSIAWQRTEGPVAGSAWVALEGGDTRHLHFRSAPEPLPADAVEEVRAERQAYSDGPLDCSVDVVVGGEAQLYATLPTGVRPPLPFACNAPFVQDPARQSIKPPATSATNRWLLERIGRHAGELMLEWLSRETLSTGERAEAYRLLPALDDIARGSVPGLTREVADSVTGSMHRAIEGKRILLTEDGSLVGAKCAFGVPDAVLGAWSWAVVGSRFDQAHRPPLARAVNRLAREKLAKRDLLESLAWDRVLQVLSDVSLPCPDTWPQLAEFWELLSPKLTGSTPTTPPRSLRIVPCAAHGLLLRASDVAIVTPDFELDLPDDDRAFLQSHLALVAPGWIQFLTEEASDAVPGDGAAGPIAPSKTMDKARDVLKALALDRAATEQQLIANAATSLTRLNPQPTEAWVRLAQIAARLRAAVSVSLRFVTKDGALRSPTELLVFDPERRLGSLLPQNALGSQLLSDTYLDYSTCSEKEWLDWVCSGAPKLHLLPPLVETQAEKYLQKQADLERHLRLLGHPGPFAYRWAEAWNKGPQYYAAWDNDFSPALLEIAEATESQSALWAVFTERILMAPSLHGLPEKLYLGAIETRTDGKVRDYVRMAKYPAAWVRRLREQECLPDTKGRYRKPAELMRRTKSTEALPRDFEAFIAFEHDTSANAEFLTALGVRESPPGPGPLLDRLRSHATVGAKPAQGVCQETDSLYRCLDKVVEGLSPGERSELSAVFGAEQLILAGDGTWQRSGAVFLPSDEVDSAPFEAIRPSVQDLKLWPSLGVQVARKPLPEARAEQDAVESDQIAQLAARAGVSERSLSIARLLENDPERRQEWERLILKPEFPSRPVHDSARRADRVSRDAQSAPARSFEAKSRSVRVSEPTQDPRTWLRENYTNPAGQMICQVCQKEMPFRRRDGEPYFECVEAFPVPSEHHALHLALCPLCAAKYQEFVKRDSAAVERLQGELAATRSIIVPLRLGTENATLRFVDLHAHDLRTVLGSGL